MKRPMSAARREILMLLRRNGPLTVDALGTLLGITPVGVRKHLDTLEIDGLIESVTERRPVGRPVQVYSLTEAADDFFPKAYDTMLLSLLRQVKRAGGDELLNTVLQGRRQELVDAFRERAANAQSLEERVAILAEVRDQAGYMAECKREDDAFLLVEYNCALCRASREFPQICETEAGLYQDVLGEEATVERVEHLAAGGRRCAYRISCKPAS